MTLAFRRANEDDIDRLVEVHLAAFPDPRGVDERKRNFALNAWGDIADLVVALRDDVIVAHAFLFALDMFFGGRPVRVGAIASVGVAPEVRGQGVFRALMTQLHRASDARGDALTLLYAYRQGIYASVGYAPTTPRRTRVFSPRSIPPAWTALAKARVRRAEGRDREAVVEAYLAAAARESAWVVRPERLWDRLFARERRQLVVATSPEDEVTGYLAFVLAQDEPHGMTTLTVDELVATDDDARRALLGFFGTMQAQVTEIHHEVRIDCALDAVLVDADVHRHGTPDIEHELGVVVGGPMVRIEDAAKAFEGRGYGRDLPDVTFDVVLVDDAPDASAMAVEIRGGAARVGAARGGPALRASRRGLAAMLYGGLRLRDVVMAGLAEAPASLAAKIEPVLAIPPLYPLDPF